MKRTFTLLAILCAMTLSGCGSATKASEVTTSVASSSTSEATATSKSPIVISEMATCSLLVGVNEDGPLIRYVTGIASVDPTDTTAIQKLRDDRDEVTAAGEHAGPEMKLLIETLFSEDMNDFKAAGTELLTRCK
ncbi:hypothetical protein [Arthrobacter livingstonensis]|uniref:hypothetical protein n=1 Tax=Arthrobacter livingstonensis TaxID=670078 RepID=UPI0011B66306|nr:hypothetical protein [Arthrobacter livingstonensis]